MEENKDGFCHRLIRTLAEVFVLKQLVMKTQGGPERKSYLILAKGHVEECDPGGVVVGVQTFVVHRLHDEVECLREAEEEDDVDD